MVKTQYLCDLCGGVKLQADLVGVCWKVGEPGEEGGRERIRRGDFHKCATHICNNCVADVKALEM